MVVRSGRTGGWLGAALVLVLILGACAPAPSGGQASAGPVAADQTLRIYEELDPTDGVILDPAWLYRDRNFTLIQNLYEGLVKLDASGKTGPGIAESWETKDQKTWTFKIRGNAKFSDGTPITAADARYSLVRSLTKLTADQMKANAVSNAFPKGFELISDVVGAADVLSGKATELPASSITAPDDRTLQIVLNAPRADLVDRLGYAAMGIVKKANVEATGRSDPWWYAPVSSGPFKVKSYTARQEIVLVPNDGYYGTKPTLTAQFTVVTDPQTAQIAYESGKLDIVKIQTKDVPNIQSTALGKEFVSHEDVNISVLISNPVNQTEELSVLRALGYAIDRKALTEQVLKGLVQPATTFTPPFVTGYNASGFNGFTFDVAKAKSELAKSKYKPSEITLNAWASTSQDPRVLEAMVQMWKENLGISVNIQQTQTPANGQLKDAANVLFVAQAANYLGPGAWMDRWPDFLVTAKGSNNVNFHAVEAPGMTQAFDAAHNASPSDIWPKVIALENLMNQYPQFIPIHYNKSYWLKKPYVDGGAIGGHWNWDLTAIKIRQH